MSAIHKRTQAKWSYIYRVRHPETLEIKYVGATIDMKRRVYQLGRGQFCSMAMRDWAHNLRNAGLKPVFEVLQKVQTKKRGPAEKSWIDYHVQQGVKLFNVDGVTRKWSNEKLT